MMAYLFIIDYGSESSHCFYYGSNRPLSDLRDSSTSYGFGCQKSSETIYIRHTCKMNTKRQTNQVHTKLVTIDKL